MRSLSKSFKKELNNDNRRYLEWVDITLKDGTALYLREDSVWNFGLKVEDAVSDSSEFKIGSAIINKATVTLNNIYDDFTDYDFEGAEIAIYVGLAISPTGMVFPEEKKWLDISENPILDTNGNEILLLYSDAVTEKIRLCTMTVVEAPYQNSSIITLTCQDNMMKFDRDYSESKLKYPATRSEIIRDACNVCGVQLQTVTFDNDDYVIETRPDDQQLTFRQVLAWVAQIGGQFCRCDSYGRLCIAWYDLKSYESSHIDEDKFVSVESYDSLSINNEDVVITGIKVTEYKENVSTDESPVSYQYGEDGYVIEIKDNKLIAEGKGNDIATIIGKRIVGMRFRPFSASMMNNPLAEAGDICIITDRKGNQYKSLVTSTIFQVGNKQTIECGAKSAARNSAKQYSLASQAIVENRKNLQKERSDREKALEELSKRISQSSGLYTTVEESQGGGKVYYLHNKALLSDSDIVWKMTAEAWGVSTDGGNTWNGGMTVDGDTVVRILDAVGVRANWINTGEFKVADEKGNEVFYVNCDTGVVRIKAQSFLLSGTSIEEISKRQLDAFVEGTYKSDMSGINGKIDTKNANYYQSSDPSLSWTTITEEALADIDGNPILDVDGNEILIRVESEKIAHEDDVWKNTSDNVEYIYKSGNWVRVMLPNDIMEQLDGKIDSYFKDYEPTLNNYPANEWLTDNDRASHNGDLFYWKSTGMCYRFVQIDGVWQWYNVKDKDIEKALENASKAQDTADGKRRNFITTPVPPYDIGDLWTQGNTGDLMRCQTARTSGNYVSSDWVKATKYTDDSAVDKLNKSLTSEEVFDRLTDNGKKQGIYLQGDQLYINFSYGKGGTLTLGGVNNENGSIQILDAIGAEVGKWDKDGLNIKKGSIYGSTIYLDKEKASALIVGRNNSKEIFTIGSMGMHIDNTNMGLLTSDSMVVDLMGGWFHGLRMKASNNGRGYGSSISPECFSIGWAEDLQGWSDAMSPVKSYTFSISENSTGCLSIRINGSNYINDYVDISPREIKTTGTKNRVVPTENYSNRLQYCYETASPMFGDIGEGITDENGECIVEIGDIFTETVTTRIEYQVFLQKEGQGDLWIEKKEENYFIVHGTPNLKFAWELKAKQKDYEYVNLEEDVDREEEVPESPENILNAELETLIKEQEELLNETA
jgi:hypothetical protein